MVSFEDVKLYSFAALLALEAMVITCAAFLAILSLTSPADFASVSSSLKFSALGIQPSVSGQEAPPETFLAETKIITKDQNGTDQLSLRNDIYCKTGPSAYSLCGYDCPSADLASCSERK
ncbi:Uncharacterised protein [Candidatus Gugararchaeum adminiculabundum]|nr:Uncharacterised protein [Candidatus Gugararchaeum adminiculabundum]